MKSSSVVPHQCVSDNPVVAVDPRIIADDMLYERPDQFPTFFAVKSRDSESMSSDEQVGLSCLGMDFDHGPQIGLSVIHLAIQAIAVCVGEVTEVIGLRKVCRMECT